MSQWLLLQEIKLLRANADDKLGLTLCDGLPVNQSICCQQAATVGCESTTTPPVGDDADTDRVRDDDADQDDQAVYIQDIQKDSLAAVDGRLRQGDIILQVKASKISIIRYRLNFNSSSRGTTEITP